MKIIPALFSLACVTAAQAASEAAPQSEICAQIRAKIMAQTGLLPKPDTALLQSLGTHAECRFSAAEVYRAAFGDKPMPRHESSNRHDRSHEDDDDD